MYDNIEYLNPYTSRVVAYSLIYAEICNGVKAGLLLSQLMYWWDKMSSTEFYKSSRQLQDECRMTKEEVMKATYKLKALGFITATRKGLPPTYYFTINVNKIFEQILEHNKKGGIYSKQLEENQKVNGRESHSSIEGKPTHISLGNPPIDDRESHSSIEGKPTQPIYNTRLLHNTTQKTTTLDTTELVKSSGMNVRENVTGNVKVVIDYFNQVCKRKVRGDKEVVKNIKAVLTQYTLDEVKAVIDYVRNNPWHIENEQVTLSAMMRPKHFLEKLERTTITRRSDYINPIRQQPGANCNTAPVEDTFAVLRRQKEEGILTVDIPPEPWDLLTSEQQKKIEDELALEKEEKKNG